MKAQHFKNVPFDLGTRVRDAVTGYEGTLVAVTLWISGHARCAVQSGYLDGGKPIEEVWFDAPRLEVVKGAKRIGFKGDAPEQPATTNPEA